MANLTNEQLRTLCIRHHWFSCGDVMQYDKFFRMNNQKYGPYELAIAIWLCSDTDLMPIDIMHIIENEITISGAAEK